MATIKQIVGAWTSISSTALSTLASATYLALTDQTPSTNDPMDVILEVLVGTTNVPAGNKQVVVFAKGSLDGTNFGSGPESGTTTTDEPDLVYVGRVPLNTSTGTANHRCFFSLANAFGFVPASYRPVFKNDCGVALTTAVVAYSEISLTVL